MKPTMGSLFAGIGGFDLGFERAGFDVAWQVEIDPWCRKVLAKHFPAAERHEDVRTVGSSTLRSVDVICGGFPCQDISTAGRGAGIVDGTRSGLWSEYARIIGELRPRFVLVENVSALLSNGMGRVLGDLAEIGYDTQWEVISAADMGAPHLRERVWILTYPHSYSFRRSDGKLSTAKGSEFRYESLRGTAGFCSHVAYSSSIRQPRQRQPWQRSSEETNGERETDISLAERVRDFWAVEPNVGRVAHGVSKRVDRLRGLGNAVVPQIPEMYARWIMAAIHDSQPNPDENGAYSR